jgi:hypothetical protein
VEGVDGERRLGRLHALVEAARARHGGIRLPGRQRAPPQKIAHLCLVADGQQAQPVGEARLDLACRLARVGDGENLARRRTVEQQPQDARHQQPGLAAAGAGLHHHGVARIERL